jgi:hypothetical protein
MDGLVYGTMDSSMGAGYVYHLSSNGATLTSVYSFGGNSGITHPKSYITLVPDPTVSGQEQTYSFFGTASAGGPDGIGGPFRIDAGGIFSALPDTVSGGSSYYGPLTLGSDGYLYGVALGHIFAMNSSGNAAYPNNWLMPFPTLGFVYDGLMQPNATNLVFDGTAYSSATSPLGFLFDFEYPEDPTVTKETDLHDFSG